MARSPRSPRKRATSPAQPVASTSGTRDDEADAEAPSTDPAPIEDASAAPVDAEAAAKAAAEAETQLDLWLAFQEEYHDIVMLLPIELQRNFTLLHELETNMLEAQTTLKEDVLGWLKHARATPAPPSKAPTTSTSRGSSAELAATLYPNGSAKRQPGKGTEAELRKHVIQGSRAAVKMGEDKVALAVTMYDWVDRHIRRLDADLTKYEDSLVIGIRAGTLPSHEVPSRSDQLHRGAGLALGDHVDDENDDDDDKGPSPRKASLRTRPASGDVKTAASTSRKGGGDKKGKKRARESDELGFLGGMPVDPNEPVYCDCKRVSFGEMVACDNDDCPYGEWFHWSCYGLDRAPRGKWFCKRCTIDMGLDKPKLAPQLPVPSQARPKKRRR